MKDQSHTATEDTLPMEADSGIRRVVVELGDERLIVQIQIRQEAREQCAGEIHPVDGFGPVTQVVTNQQLVTACLAIAKAAATAPRLQSLQP